MPGRSFARRPGPSRTPGTSWRSRSPHKYSGPPSRPPQTPSSSPPESRVRARGASSSWARTSATAVCTSCATIAALDWITKCRPRNVANFSVKKVWTSISIRVEFTLTLRDGHFVFSFCWDSRSAPGLWHNLTGNHHHFCTTPASSMSF